eukprot:gene10042-biopygen21283
MCGGGEGGFGGSTRQEGAVRVESRRHFQSWVRRGGNGRRHTKKAQRRRQRQRARPRCTFTVQLRSRTGRGETKAMPSTRRNSQRTNIAQMLALMRKYEIPEIPTHPPPTQTRKPPHAPLRSYGATHATSPGSTKAKRKLTRTGRGPGADRTWAARLNPKERGWTGRVQRRSPHQQDARCRRLLLGGAVKTTIPR